MKSNLQRKFCRLLFRTTIAVATVLWATLNIYAIQDSGVLQPRKSTGVPVHWPDLQNLESYVRAHIKSEQENLAAVVKDQTSTDAKLSEAYGAMGRIYQAYSLSAPARECYLNASQLSPKDFRWVYLLAKLSQQNGDVHDAIRQLQIAGSLAPDYVAIKVTLGNIFLELNRLEEAKTNFATALNIEKNNPAAYYGLGQVALSQRSYADAVNNFEQALALAPAANRIHYALGIAYRGLGATEKARNHLAKRGTVGVRVADPLIDTLQQLVLGASLHSIRGKQALEANRFADAAEEFRKALAADPDSVSARVNLGATLTQLGDLKGAADQFEAALQIDPKNINAHYNLAVLLAGENNHEQAVAHLRAVSQINPNDLNARFLLAQQLTKLQNLDAAVQEFSFIVDADPNREESLLEMVKLLHQKKRYKDALNALEKAHAKYPQKTQTLIALAYLLAASPQYDLRNGARALELAQVAYQATGSIQHGVVVALALAELGRCEEAAEWQRKMIAAAAQSQNVEVQAKLEADLRRYEKRESCRPPAEP